MKITKIYSDGKHGYLNESTNSYFYIVFELEFVECCLTDFIELIKSYKESTYTISDYNRKITVRIPCKETVDKVDIKDLLENPTRQLMLSNSEIKPLAFLADVLLKFQIYFEQTLDKPN